MPRRYPVEFRRKVLDLISAGRPVAEVAAELGITAQTVYNWRNLDEIDRGLRAGLSTSESTVMTLAEIPQVCSSKFPTCEAWSS